MTPTSERLHPQAYASGFMAGIKLMNQEKKSLGEWLLDQGIITQSALEEARIEEKSSGEPMRKVLIRMGLVNEDDMVNFISQQMDIQRIDLNNYLIDSKIIGLVPETLARKQSSIKTFSLLSNIPIIKHLSNQFS